MVTSFRLMVSLKTVNPKFKQLPRKSETHRDECIAIMEEALPSASPAGGGLAGSAEKEGRTSKKPLFTSKGSSGAAQLECV